jgi:copper chaperone
MFKKGAPMADTITYSVPDMSCGHCRASIEKALAPMGAKPEFDAAERRISLPVTLDSSSVIAALKDIGYDAKPVDA